MHRHAVARPVIGEELALEAGHVDADGTLRLARPALEAEIQHFIDAVIAETCFAYPPRHRKTQNIRAAAG